MHFNWDRTSGGFLKTQANKPTKKGERENKRKHLLTANKYERNLKKNNC